MNKSTPVLLSLERGSTRKRRDRGELLPASGPLFVGLPTANLDLAQGHSPFEGTLTWATEATWPRHGITMRTLPTRLRWPTIVLVLAGAYNLIWSGCMILVPLESFAWSGMERPDKPLHYPQLWQGLGMVIGVFGLGYLLAATDPMRHWGVVLIGLVSKVLGGLGSVSAVVTGQSPPWAILLTLVNDLAWWLPFGLILRHAYRSRRDSS